MSGIAPAPGLTIARRDVLRRRIRWIVAGTIAWNTVEAVVALTAGAVASSTALVAFGLDSIVEVLAASAVAWQFSAPDPEARERTALWLIAVSFLGLAAYVSVDAVLALAGGSEARPSTTGIVLAALSIAVMPALSLLERRTGTELGSASAVADSRQTLVCAWLSAALLVGLLLDAGLGWWWADPVAGLAIAAFAVREGLEAWRGDACTVPVGALTGEREADADADADAHRDACC
ncbi:cobalt transporter [Clavibacter michiganensis]|uniref:cation transporter n=1 Tax=Clavibacter michiganensis TaxID=28447 RepID=UPI000CE8265C|nr:cation transporter [Clavibacter michiganensis]PPF88657.1 cobalt transporter [Clavibacter michiganensis]PPF96282.1 cobalt transporter [Clavibacter michiganensis]